MNCPKCYAIKGMKVITSIPPAAHLNTPEFMLWCLVCGTIGKTFNLEDANKLREIRTPKAMTGGI